MSASLYACGIARSAMADLLDVDPVATSRVAIEAVLAALNRATGDEREAIAIELRRLEPGPARHSLTLMAEAALGAGPDE